MSMLFWEILNLSLTASLAALAVLLWRMVLRRCFTPLLEYGVWAAVWFRFLFPFSVRSIFSLYNFLPDSAIGDTGHLRLAGVAGSSITEAVSGRNPLLFSAVALLWAIVAAGLALFLTASYLYMRCRFSTAVLLHDSATLAEACRALKYKKSVQLYASSAIFTPVVVGVVHPRIIVPEGGTAAYEQYALMHELVHLRRRDSVWKLFAVVVLCLHWFNPLVWLCYRLFCRDLERACDDTVLSACGEEKKADYAEALLFYTKNGQTQLPVLGFSRTGVGQRIESALHYCHPPRAVLVLLTVLTLFLAFSVFTDPLLPRNTYYPASVWVNSETKRETALQEQALTLALAQGDAKALAGLSGPDADYFAALYECLSPVLFQQPGKTYYTSRSTAEFYFTVEAAPDGVLPQGNRNYVAVFADNSIFQKRFLSGIYPAEVYAGSRLVDTKNEAYETSCRLMEYGITDGFSAPEEIGKAKIAAFCADLAHAQTGESLFEAQKIAEFAKEYFGISDFSCTDDPAVYDNIAGCYRYAPEKKLYPEYLVSGLTETAEGVTVSAIIYSDPIHLIAERQISYSFRKS